MRTILDVMPRLAHRERTVTCIVPALHSAGELYRIRKHCRGLSKYGYLAMLERSNSIFQR